MSARRRRIALAAFGAALVLASCGSTKSSGTLTVRGVLAATQRETTFRFSTRSAVGGLALPTPYSGQERGDTASIVMKYPGHQGEFDAIFADHKAYERVMSPDRSEAFGWCLGKTSKARGYPRLGPVDTLAGLAARGRSLRKVGNEPVRGTPTLHYSIVGAKPPVNIWVDGKDRLRRLVWTHRKQTDTIELYDFGVPVTITVPAHASPCPLIPPGFVKPGTCILGRSFATLPKCPGKAVTR